MNRSKWALILIMIIIVVTGISIARSYYGNLNRSIDPRIKQARALYAEYDILAQEGNFSKVFALLDSIEKIYAAQPHYYNSFETGVLYNNRTAALLTISIYADTIPEEYNPYFEINRDSLVTLADMNARIAIGLYENWLTGYRGKSHSEISDLIKPLFLQGLENEPPEKKEKYLETRVMDIENAIAENDRRLSVCYTNLGLVYRQKGKYKEAIEQYEKALELWDRNLTAENNINLLLDRPVKKRNFIQRLFPPEKDQ